MSIYIEDCEDKAETLIKRRNKMSRISELCKDKAEAVDVDCEDDTCECEKFVPLEETKLADFEKRLQNDLERSLKRIEYEKKCDEIRKRFKAEHAEEYAKIKEYESESFMEERICSSRDCELAEKNWLDDAQLSELKAKYKALEARQIEILDITTSKEEIQNWADGQLDALINEYLASEKLKLIIVDRIKSNICKRDIDLGVHSFGGNHMEITPDVEYDPNNHCSHCR